MLAAQRQPAAMASGRQPEDEPLSYFGYDFPLPQNAPLPAGAPLLSDNERSALDDWLQIFMGNAGPTDNNLSLDPVHSENWNDMPPQFVGSTTSFGPSSSRNMQNPFSSNFDLPLIPSLTGTQPLQHQHAANAVSPLGPAGGSRSNSSPTIPLHHSPGLGHHFSGAAAGNMQGTGAHNHMLSEDVFSAAHVLMQNSHTPASRHASFGYQARPTNLATQYHNSNLIMQNGGQQTLDPSHHMSPTTLLQAASHIAGPQMAARHASIATSMGAGANASLGLQLGGAGSPTAGAFAGAEMVGGVSSFNLPTAADSQATHEPELQWGTDQSFRHKQFVPRSIQETSDVIIHKKLEVMECLEVNPSAATTRQATPTFELEPDSNGSNAVSFNLKTRTTSFVSNGGQSPVPGTSDAMAPPRKKRKSKSAVSSKSMPAVAGDADHDEDAIDGIGEYAHGNGDNDDEDTANGALAKSGKARKRKTKAAAAQSLKSSASPPDLGSIPERSVSQDGNDSSGAQAPGTPTSASATKRRRSAQVKLPRENLTEEQKRENHIKSEQKRRTLIKNGFEDLGVLVPGLDGGSHSKSTMLMLAANYLEELLKGNKQLREQAMQL